VTLPPVDVRPEAEAELRDAFAWYEARRPGLGEDHLGCVQAAVESACRNPELHPAVHGAVRRALTRRFPHAVFFVADDAGIVVLAFLHARRDPAGLARRLDEGG
jgi:toxin ParE1/3/4